MSDDEGVRADIEAIGPELRALLGGALEPSV